MHRESTAEQVSRLSESAGTLFIGYWSLMVDGYLFAHRDCLCWPPLNSLCRVTNIQCPMPMQMHTRTHVTYVYAYYCMRRATTPIIQCESYM